MRSLLELIANNPNLEALHEPGSGFDIFLATLEDLRRSGPFSPVFWRPASPAKPVDMLGRSAGHQDSGQDHAGHASRSGGRSTPSPSQRRFGR